MPGIAIGLGAILTLLGLGGYFGSGMVSKTALIPAAFGVPILVAGLFALKDKFRKHAMHVAVAFALLGFLGAARGIPGAVTMLTGGEVERPQAVIAQAVMALACLIFVILGVKSFVDARRSRAQQPAAE